ncbi:histidine kinase [Flavobacterium longum]|uniref:hybrid sensor histidine kinase/response regulator n=1 Tax=Flavobacterium longum TaxID=1299340 RepID=UPI0039EC06E4
MRKKLPKLYLLPLCALFFSNFLHSQLILSENSGPEHLSLFPHARIANAGNDPIDVRQLITGQRRLDFRPVTGENMDLGFNTDNFWVTFSIRNAASKPLEYYLETARPITDTVELYIVRPDKSYVTMRTGDHMKTSDRAYPHRKSIFKLLLPADTEMQYYIRLRSDGEVINLPLELRTYEDLMWLTSLEQFTFGIFYGILFLAALVYLFFFFGLKERTFIYYSMYVVFIGLLQFSLDGYFYQYITPNGNWLSCHAVLLFALVAAYFLGRYSQVFLKLKTFDPMMNRLFNGLYVVIVLWTVIFVGMPSALAVSYPVVNILGMFVLTLIIASVVRLYKNRHPVDMFFTAGIFFLVAGFVIFILNNFGQIPTSFISQNSSKFGTGLEVIFLSLSMANLIRRVKNEREEFNRLALARAEEMNEMKTYFLSNISHELRTPLNAILTLSSELSKNADDDKVRHDAQVIKYSAHGLLSSVNDILDFSKIEKDQLQFEEVQFDPVRVLEHIKNNATIRANDADLVFEYQKSGIFPELLLGDVTRLGQIVNNILSNAIKFTAEGKVTFTLEGQPLPDNRCRLTITVTDTGVGIAKEKMHNIFESFTQDNINNKRKFGGLGLGLYIVKNLVDRQHGKITLDSKLGEGTICRVVLDYAVVAVEKVTETPAATSEFDLGGRHLLVVEDNAINQMVIKMILKKWQNATAEYAVNGREALDKLQSAQFDLILMDLQMPVMDGYEATEAIRKGEAGDQYRNIPIIAVTADVMETSKATAREIGMNDYLTKPLKNETLYEAVKKWL